MWERLSSSTEARAGIGAVDRMGIPDRRLFQRSSVTYLSKKVTEWKIYEESGKQGADSGSVLSARAAVCKQSETQVPRELRSRKDTCASAPGLGETVFDFHCRKPGCGKVYPQTGKKGTDWRQENPKQRQSREIIASNVGIAIAV